MKTPHLVVALTAVAAAVAGTSTVLVPQGVDEGSTAVRAPGFIPPTRVAADGDITER